MQLDDVLADAMDRLSRGVSDRDSPFRTLGVATAGPDGPALRTVVLRGFEADARCLWFHTDDRAAKVAQLRAQPAVALMGWDPASRVQLRLDGRATLHANDAPARAQWAALHGGARQTYRTGPRSGTVLDDPASAERDQVSEDQAFGNFCAVRVALHAVEWLRLDPPEAPHGQRRARFSWDGSPTDGRWAGRWLVP